MAYDPVNPADIQAGKPTKEEIFTKLVDNQDSFNTDIEALKQTSRQDIMDIRFSGSVGQYSATELAGRVPVYKAPVTISITSFVLTLLEASTSGTLEVEIDRSTDNGINWTPLLSSPVVLSGTTVGSISGSVTFVDAASQIINENELMRLRITGVQVDQGSFHVSIYGEVS